MPNAPVPRDSDTRRRMQRQRGTGTAPEVALRKELWRRGLRYRVDTPLDGRRRRVDIVFTRQRVAVFVDGCFWHLCPEHGTMPRNNAEWWREKLEANRRRDEDSTARLEAAGWLVVRIWEHEAVHEAADRVEEALHRRSAE